MGITIWQHLSERSEEMARNALKDVKTLEEWKKIRPQRHRDFMRSLGLDPLPERCDLKATDRGAFKGKGFRARKIAFQVLPDCWNSAAVYYPDPAPRGKAPGVLYVCGHASIGTYHYQYHPIMWARRGYVCLIVDTIEQNDNPGEHHGSMMGKFEAWLSMGYTPAGAEVWNAMRALDILASEPGVDPERLAVTGVSGGGSCSFHTAVADERLKAVSTLCGVSSPLDAIANRHVMGHCDCMYSHNVYQRDISEYAALIAPRAALFCIADHDPLFHPAESRALVERTKPVYKLYGLEDRCAWLACPGPHGDHPEFDEGTSRWFDKHVAGDERALIKRGTREIDESVTNTFKGCPPVPNRLDLLPQLVSPRGQVPLPKNAAEWPAIRREALKKLKIEVPFLFAKGYRKADMKQDGDWRWAAGEKPILFRIHRGQIDGMDVWLQMIVYSGARKKVVVGIGGEGQFAMHAVCRVACNIDAKSVVYGGFEPRLAGYGSPATLPVLFPPGARLSGVQNYTLRLMALAGMTPAVVTFHDIGVLLDYLAGLEETRDCEIYLYGSGDSGAAVLYRALIDERITGIILDDLPSSHLHGAPVLGVLRAFDIPQAVGLMAPRKVALVTAGHSFWTWPNRAYERLGCPERLIMADDLRGAMEKILA